MRKIVIKVASLLGFLSVAEAQNNKIGAGIVGTFKKMKTDAEAHAEKCDELANLQIAKAEQVEAKTQAKCNKRTEKAEARLRKSLDKATIISDKGASKGKKLKLGAESSQLLAYESRNFASNIEKLLT